MSFIPNLRLKAFSIFQVLKTSISKLGIFVIFQSLFSLFPGKFIMFFNQMIGFVMINVQFFVAGFH
jgi:hypothetical protein